MCGDVSHVFLHFRSRRGLTLRCPACRTVQRVSAAVRAAQPSLGVCRTIIRLDRDSSPQSVERVLHQPFDIDRVAQLAIDAEHGHAMHERPNVAGHEQRFVRTHQRVALQRRERIDKRTEGTLAFDGEISVLRLWVNEPAEHHAIVRRVRDRETDVGDTHGTERRVPTAS